MASPNPEYHVLVYRIYGPDGLIYVGQTKNIHARLLAHRTKAWWPVSPLITVEGPYRRTTALEVERQAIALERPSLNGTPSTRTRKPLKS